FERFQTIMADQVREKTYDILDIRVRPLHGVTNQNHTRNLLQSIEINNRRTKEERYIVLDLNSLQIFHLKDSTSWNDNTTLPLHYNESRMWKREADRIDMRFFRYGGVKVTYFLPRSVQPVTLLKSSTVDYSTNRLSLPSFEKKALADSVGNFTNDLFVMDDTEVFQGRQTHDFDKGREWIITTIVDEPFTMINYTAAGNLRGSTVAGQILSFDHLYGYCV
ncbi:unnamed protein product, partial [Didymodactylos carnosus]